MKTDIISIVDDDKIYQYTMTKTIEATRRCKKILVFSDGEEAFNFLTENKADEASLPDIIFLDINMPYMDGWEFLAEFALLKPKLAKEIIVYMVSSSVSTLDINRAKEISEVTGYIVKPISIDKFNELMDRLQNL